MKTLEHLKKEDFSDKGLEGEEMTKAEILFKGHRVDFYWKKGVGYFVIIRNFYVGLVDRELDGIKTLSQAKKAVEKEFK